MGLWDFYSMHVSGDYLKESAMSINTKYRDALKK